MGPPSKSLGPQALWLAAELPQQRFGDRDRMSQHHTQIAQHCLWLVEHAELTEDHRAVVIDAFAGKAIIGVEGVDPTEWDLDAPPRRRKPAPASEMRAANHHFQHDGFVCNMTLHDLD